MNKGWIVKREALDAIEVKAEYIKNDVGTLLVREVTPADEAKLKDAEDAFLKITRSHGNAFHNALATEWLQKYGTPEGTANE